MKMQKIVPFNIKFLSVLTLSFAAIVLFFFQLNSLSAAQGGGGTGGETSNGSGGAAVIPTGTQDQIRDQDRVQDPTTHDGDEPLLDRDQTRDQDRLYTSTTSTTSTGVGDQNREQNRERIMIQLENDVPRAAKFTDLQLRITAREQELEQERLNASSSVQAILKNQNQVRLAVHALLAAEDLVPGIGSEVSAIAREFNNSVQATVEAENRIETRSRFVRFFIGGDFDSAREMVGYVEQNRARIEELNRLLADCDCTAEVRTQLKVQLTNMENEQIRLEEKAEKELSWRGLFGWFRD